MDKSELLLQELTNANGVSGYESEVRKIMARELNKSADSIVYDKMGSILGIKKGFVEAPRIMTVGHMDEVGFMVKEITSEGFIKFLPLGGWWGHVALGQRMRIITSKGVIIGVVGSTPPHLLPPEERKKVIEIKDMFIDVGATKKFDVKKKLGVCPGDPIVPDSEFTILANKNTYMAKAFDNRVACAIVLEVMEKLKKVKHPNTVLGGATVQEEVGLRGATTVAHLGDPDVCIVVDTGIAQDMPPNTFAKEERLGAGPVVLIYDAGMIPNIKLRDLVFKTAKDIKIPFHVSTMAGGATDGGRVHISRVGVPSIVIGPAVRYIHSHNSILDRSDYDNTIKLVFELIKKLDKKTVKSLTED